MLVCSFRLPKVRLDSGFRKAAGILAGAAAAFVAAMMLSASAVQAQESLAGRAGEPMLLPEIRIGLTNACRQESAFINETLEAVRQAFAGRYSVQSVPLESDDALAQAVEKEEIDVFIGSSAQYRQHAAKGVRDIASVVTAYSTNPNRAVGSVVLVRADRFDIMRLLDLGEKRVAASQEDGFFGLNAVLADISAAYQSDRRSVPANFFERAESMTDAPAILQALLDERVDAAILQSCTLERMSAALLRAGIDTSLLRVVEPKQEDAMHCLHSTSLYPGLTAASLPTLPPSAAMTLARALTELAPASGMRWRTATDFSRVDRSLQELGIDVWGPYRQWSPIAFLKRYWVWIAAVAVCLAALLIHAVVVSWLVKVRTRALEEALRHVKTVNRRVEKLQKIAVLGQFATLLAHELRQPLNSIVCYAHGLRRFQEKLRSIEDLPAAQSVHRELTAGIDGIEMQTARADAIVSRVRDYVRSHARRGEVHDLRKVVESGIQTFGKTSLGSMRVTWRRPEAAIPVRCDGLEMELVVINLLRNAAEAQQDAGKTAAVICAEIKPSGEETEACELTIADNGDALTDEDFERITSAGDTTKPEGLGLGLSIVRTLVEANGGELAFERGAKRGLVVRIRLPIRRGEGNAQSRE